MNMDDVACITALAAAIVSIAVGAVSVIGPKTKHATSVAQECPRAHATATSTQIAPPTYRAL